MIKRADLTDELIENLFSHLVERSVKVGVFKAEAERQTRLMFSEPMLDFTPFVESYLDYLGMQKSLYNNFRNNNPDMDVPVFEYVRWLSINSFAMVDPAKFSKSEMEGLKDE